jgi:phosphatidylserine/phosphatidylglycerophosphate/cardiolipin synthase-like enzyme
MASQVLRPRVAAAATLLLVVALAAQGCRAPGASSAASRSPGGSASAGSASAGSASAGPAVPATPAGAASSQPAGTPTATPLGPLTATPTSAPSTAATPATPASGQLSLLVEPDQGIEPIYALIASARKSIDLTMYELVDTNADLALELAASRGVVVRVLLDVNREKSANQAAYDELSDMKVHVAWADPRYAATHQKTLVIDNSVAAVMTLNMTSRYYSSTRDFAVIDRIPNDVAAIEQVFNADFAHKTTSTPAATDLVWSPHLSEPVLLSLIDSATASLLVENEEMSDKQVTAALASAAQRGVRVTVVMTDETDWHAAFATLVAAHVLVRTYADTASSLYIHAKVIVADAGTSRQRAFVGSENFSAASLNDNRELGLETTNPTIVAGLSATLNSDAAGAAVWRP